jgi:hypothetical protein
MAHKEKFYSTNVISSAVVRTILHVRNNMVFNYQVWSDVKFVLRMALRILMAWKVIYKEAKTPEMMKWLSFLEQLIREPLRIESVWSSLQEISLPASWSLE